MAELYKGAQVAKAINEDSIRRVEALKVRGVDPTLAILRVGDREDDLSYERGAVKRAEQVGVSIRLITLPVDVTEEEFDRTLQGLNEDNEVHGILMFRPLPKHLDSEKARKSLSYEKDVDGCTDGSLSGVFTNTNMGFAPCTAEAAMAILDYYGVDLTGKSVAVIGRSLVIGRPVAMMLMHKNATVTICHTKTKDVRTVTKQADIVIACSGQMESIDASYLSENQIVIDVGIGWNDKKNKLCGDVLFEDVEPHVAGITPVPGGVGAVTTSVLISHVVTAAERMNE